MPEALTLKGHDQSSVAAVSQTPDNAATITSTSRGSPSPTGKTKHSKQSLDYMLRSGLSGGAAGCAAKSLIAPLDRVKILFQASNPQFIKYTGSWNGVLAAVRDIRRNDGVVGLFRGHSATLLRIFPYAAIKFIAYEQIRAVLIRNPQQERSWERRFASGSLAGVTSVFCTYPLEIVRVRLAFETRKDHRLGLRELCRSIYRERHTSYPLLGGYSNFYRGFSPTVLGMFPYAGISFLSHDIAGDFLRSKEYALSSENPHNKKKPVLKAWAELASGGFAGMAGQTASYPLEVVRRRMQVGGAIGDVKFPGIVETGAKIWRENGLRGFFVGLSIGYAKVVPMVATSFFVYERCKLYLGIS
ncbi:mitochondrial carrier domain-containing protein [Trichophaea hybrida]|nr:mitochondrial carrier domain-containing protein [Trichophaea hybrida]